MWRKRNSTVGENINLFSHYIKQYDGSLKAKIKVNIRFCNNTSRRISRRKKKNIIQKIHVPQYSLQHYLH